MNLEINLIHTKNEVYKQTICGVTGSYVRYYFLTGCSDFVESCRPQEIAWFQEVEK